MSFKAQVAEDRSAVFLDPEYFGEGHVVAGVTVTCVLDTATEDGRDPSMGIPGDHLTLYARVEELPGRVPPGGVVVVDGTSYVVESWQEDMGVIEASLVRAE